MRNSKITCRIEEIPALSELMRDNYLRDRQLFAAFSPVFDEAFLQQYDTQEKKVKELIEPMGLTGEMKTITVRIAGHYNNARTLINKVEFYAKMAATGLSLKPADFGFRLLRKNLVRRNDEGITRGLRGLLQQIDANRAGLREKGLSDDFYNELSAFIDEFGKDSLDQVRKLKERAELVRNNRGEFNVMWELITCISYAGQILAKERNDRNMLADYTKRNLIRKVRIIRKSGEEVGETIIQPSGNLSEDRPAA